MRFLGGISNNWPKLLIFLLEDYCFMFLMIQDHGFDDTEYNPSGNSKFLFHFGSDILNLLFLWLFNIFPCIVHAKI